MRMCLSSTTVVEHVAPFNSVSSWDRLSSIAFAWPLAGGRRASKRWPFVRLDSRRPEMGARGKRKRRVMLRAIREHLLETLPLQSATAIGGTPDQWEWLTHNEKVARVIIYGAAKKHLCKTSCSLLCEAVQSVDLSAGGYLQRALALTRISVHALGDGRNVNKTWEHLAALIAQWQCNGWLTEQGFENLTSGMLQVWPRACIEVTQYLEVIMLDISGTRKFVPRKVADTSTRQYHAI